MNRITAYLFSFLLSLITVAMHAQINLDNGLVGKYYFSGNANDGSPKGNNGTVSGAILTEDRFGNANSAYSFDGINDFISLPDKDFKNANYSFSLWASPTTIPGSGGIGNMLSIGKDQFLCLTNNYNVWTGWALIGYNVGGSVQNPRVTTLPSINKWYHIVGQRTNEKIYLYVNGQAVDSFVTGGTAAYTGTMALIGNRESLSQYFKGKIDDIRIYNRVLNECEIIALANEGNVNSVIGDYSFTGNANDASSNANHGVINGATLTIDRFGNPNSAYSFDGINDYISLSPDNLMVDNYTYSTWVNIKTIPGVGIGKFILSIGGEKDQFLFVSNDYSANGNTGWSVGGYDIGGNTVSTYYSGSLPNVDVWYHFVSTRDNKNVKLYINGSLIATAAANTLPFYGTSGYVASIGARSGDNRFFDGKIDDIKIYNRALSACEISDLYNSEVVTSINSKKVNALNISIYPNPLSNQQSLRVESDELQNAEMRLYNSLGEEVYLIENVNQTAQLNLNLTQGIYILKIKSDKGEVSRKIIIN